MPSSNCTDCVEVAWRKSRYSGQSGTSCVEVAFAVSGVAVRGSKNATGPMLTLPAPAWHRLLRDLH